MVQNCVRLVGAALVVVAVGCCSTAPPRVVEVPVPVKCPAPVLPPRPIVARCLPADSDAECAARAITSLILLEGYTEKLEALLKAYAEQPPK